MLKIKFISIPFIALGLVLSLSIGVTYQCNGPEMFPDYYGSPFIFKQKSLGSSMEYYYSISGLVLNIMIWSIALYFIDKGVQKIVKKKIFNSVYKAIVTLLFIYATLNILMDAAMLGVGFKENLNYWYWNIDKEAEDWGVTCQRELVLSIN